MTNFNRSQIQRTSHDWLAIADEANDKSGNPSLIVTAGVVGGLAFASLTAAPLAAAIPIGWGIWEAWKVNDKKAKNDEAIAVGCVASILTSELFHQFRQQVGDEAVYDQLDWAEESGLPLSQDAQDFLSWYRQFKQPQPQLPAAETAGELPASQSQESAEVLPQQEQRQMVGVNTRLNAIETAATPVDREVKELEPIFDLPDEQPAARFKSPVDYLIGDRLRTSLLVAVSGGGKDYLLANALRVFLPQHPGFRVVAMDCKDDEKEYGYLGGLPNVSVHRLNVAIASDGEVVEWVDGCLQEFVSIPEKALLVCNEGTLIRAKSKRYIDVIAGLVSSGDSREKYAWEAGQSAHADDLGINSAARSRFRPLIIGLKGEEMQIEAILQAKFVADSARNIDDAKAQMMRSPVNRAWSDGQAWYAMPELDNHCGYDRDSRSYIGLGDLRTRALLERTLDSNELNADEYHPEQFNLNASISDLETLEALFNEVIGSPIELSKPAQAILEKAQKKNVEHEWIDAKWVKQYCFYTAELKQFSADEIRDFFYELVEAGRGSVEDSGESLKWCLDPQ